MKNDYNGEKILIVSWAVIILPYFAGDGTALNPLTIAGLAICLGFYIVYKIGSYQSRKERHEREREREARQREWEQERKYQTNNSR